LVGPRLSLDTSEGSDVKSVYGVPTLVLVAEAERAGTEEVSVNGEGGAAAAAAAPGGVVWPLGEVWGGAAMMSRDDKLA
jgi:hypothetical protein